MKPKYRMLLDRSGEAIERLPPGFFGWNRLEWFTMELESRLQPNATPPAKGGTLSVGLRLGQAYHYLTQVMVGRAPLSRVFIESTAPDGWRLQMKFGDVAVVQTDLINGVGRVGLTFGKTW